ncbi:anhydro-N-acetylmuramic acid kinase [Rhodobacter sp. TJ_12]|uniref:anhydro-N-acetylmuramic acid kinase n=1 Tax=Rhodobacter sp. TJ_12 TaxID=2029399 RepID=UPI001CBAFD67|nr:anhydro-N-acetylmuramic acid kinase [Rhodobacter sp. TJ_12]MBZ4022986.1 anhydro-N-acetylmuramic acid kinase [Rhodobacter sp. TJ_12]
MLKAQPVWALGAMSGTSLDGVDAACLHTDGVEILAFGPTLYRAYRAEERAAIHAVLGAWPGAQGVAQAAEVVETAHAEVLSALLTRCPEAELVGFHGQTLAHDPLGATGAPRTHQVGDGDLLAEVLDRPVVWDFRSSDVELGGQGAPLAPFFHFACAKWASLTEPVVFLNLGGVGNVTFVDPREPGPEVAGACLAFDTGPANAPINDLMQARLGQGYDAGGALAQAGRVDEAFVTRFLNHGYFLKMPPKSLDRNDFAQALEGVEALSDADAVATLTACAAAAVARGFEHFPSAPAAVYVAGGGRLNLALMTELARRLPCPVAPVEDLGLNGDMLEAQAFAYLAVRVARGLPTSGPFTTGVAALVGGGRVSKPQGL